VFLFSKKQSPETLLAKLNTIYDLMQKNRLPEALSLLNDFIKQVPDNAKALGYRGEVHGRLGNIPAAIDDLKKAVNLKPTASDYFNLALAYLHSQNNTEAFATLLRALQLRPHDKEGWSLRNDLAKAVGLEDLDGVARLVEQFAYSQCGSGEEWKVELRKMYRFLGNQHVEEYNAVVLDLCQQPLALVQIQILPLEYKIIINYEKVFPNTTQRTFVDAVTRTIPANDAGLLNVFDEFIKDGVLVKKNHCLRYVSHQNAT